MVIASDLNIENGNGNGNNNKEISPIVPQGKNAIQELATRLQVSSEVLQKTLKATAFKDCTTNEQFISAVIVANTYGLNPILKEMYAFPSKGGAVIPIISIDGWISLVNRSPKFNGIELIENKCDKKDRISDPSGAGVESVTAKFYLKGVDHAVVVTEYMAECYNDSKEPWKKWSRRMLRHKAYIQGARVAFGFSGIYDEDEADRIKEAEYSIDNTKIMNSNGIVGFKKTTEKKIVEPAVESVSCSPSTTAVSSAVESEKIPPLSIEEEKIKQKRDVFLASMEAAKNVLGNEKYFSMLGEFGVEKADEIFEQKDRDKILKQLRELHSREKQK
jgi:phage recombination protein Bet